MVSLHSNRTELKGKKLVPEVGYCHDRLDHTTCWCNVDFGLEKAKDSGAESNVDYNSPSQVVSEENNISK